MKFTGEATTEFKVTIGNKEAFVKHIEGDLKEHFWDCTDDYPDAVENIVYQFLQNSSEYRNIGGVYTSAKHIEGWGDFYKDRASGSWKSIEDVGDITIVADEEPCIWISGRY